ncbi:GGDEF domain-containing protein [Pollutimonas sp. H1-120]|uniref:GGDEF domain-containing protein n=1 Tax=Pollutimonas sp. H1-120 TaxID=3148824 RepID=UPI003B525D30
MKFEPVSAEQALMLLGPTLALLFASCFMWIWRKHGKQRCMLYQAAAFACFAGGAAFNGLFVARGLDASSVLANIFFSLSAWLLAAGFVCRAREKDFSPALYAAVLAAIVAGQLYFFYVSPRLATRMHILNFGCGFILLLAWSRIGVLRRGSFANRALYWVYTSFTLSLFLYAIRLAVAPMASEAPGAEDAAGWAATHLASVLFIVVLAVLLLIGVLEKKIVELRRDRDHDMLTTMLNRRGFVSQAQPVLNRRTAGTAVTSLLLVDLDDFKLINDTYSHAVGDAVLAEVGKIIRRTIRTGDIAGRIGGEEFAILLPATDVLGARDLAERIRVSLAANQFPGLPRTHRVTASIGVASGKLTDTLYTLMNRADGLLYEAKRFGRNRVMLTA